MVPKNEPKNDLLFALRYYTMIGWADFESPKMGHVLGPLLDPKMEPKQIP